MAPSKKQPSSPRSLLMRTTRWLYMDEPGIPLSFKIMLFHDYKQIAILPKLSRIGEGNRWITVDPKNGHQYRVELVDAVGAFLLRRGWDILAVTENLREGDKLMFLQTEPDVFVMWTIFPVQHAPPLGFNLARSPTAVLQDVNPTQVIVNRGRPDHALVPHTIVKVWNASSIGGPIYVCHLLISPSEGDFLIFNKIYTALIPKRQASVAMRYVGSDLIIPGAIKTYGDGNARMVKEWRLYATQHSLTRDEIFVCKIHRGPGAWEFIGCCARPE